MTAPALKVEEWVSLLKSQETTWSSVYPQDALEKGHGCLLHHLLEVIILGSFL